MTEENEMYCKRLISAAANLIDINTLTFQWSTTQGVDPDVVTEVLSIAFEQDGQPVAFLSLSVNVGDDKLAAYLREQVEQFIAPHSAP
jgi:hypothetical protein